MNWLPRIPERVCRLVCLALGCAALAVGGVAFLLSVAILLLACLVCLFGVWLIEPDVLSGDV